MALELNCWFIKKTNNSTFLCKNDCFSVYYMFKLRQRKSYIERKKLTLSEERERCNGKDL